jgi:alpha-glucosidase (family GH31 glycosyl hydrolase)
MRGLHCSSLYKRVLKPVLLTTLVFQSADGWGQDVGRSTAAADPRATVVDGNARFTVLTPQLIRMEWSADGRFEDRPSLVFIQRKMPVPAFTQVVHGSGSSKQLTIHTDALDLTYEPALGKGGSFTEQSLHVSLKLDGKEVVWHPGLVDKGNLLGTTRTLDGAKGGQTKSPMEPGILSRDGWAVVDDSARPLFDSDDFRFKEGENSPWPWAMQRPAGERQDLYFFGYGHDYKRALGDFVQVAGRIPLPPRFAFGSWWSRFWSYSDQEFDALVAGFKANDVPLDVLVIDMGWHPDYGFKRDVKDQSGERKGWTGYSWNKLLFPQPQEFLEDLHREGLKTTLNLHPKGGVQPWEDAYPAMATAMGIDPKTQKYVPFDITNKKFATNYMDLLHHPLERQGVDFWWLDWQAENTTPIAGLSPTWWLNYVHFTDQEREGKRPLLFHRWGGLGNHRYEIGFSGDTISVWDSLDFQPWFTATAANVGYAYWSHDIGGHMPGAVEPELYTRWVQFGAFSPILRTHTTSNPDSERRIWANPEPYSDVMRAAFHLRYALQPYIYTEARRTYDTGVAFFHPLYYDWPESQEAYTSRNEYMFGNSMIVAPVTKPVDPAAQMANEEVWLPKGDWIEWFTGKHLAGPVTVKRNFSISQIPIYVRAGAILPMMPEMEYTGEKPVDPLILNVAPLADGQRSSYTVYEDSGKAEEYQKGVCSWTEIEASRQGSDIEIKVEPVKGEFPGMLKRRGFEVRLPGDWPPSSVTINGISENFEKEPTKPGWRFEGNTLTTVITVSQRAVDQSTTIRVHRSPELIARESELSGFAGEMTRYAESSDIANHAGMGTWAPDSLIDLLQTGDRLSYTPNLASGEVRLLASRYLAAMTDLQRMLHEAQTKTAPVSFPVEKKDASVEEAETHRVQFLERAIEMLKDAQPPADPNP